MTEILTESYCERCGAKFTFESAAAADGPLTRARMLVRAVRNYVTGDVSLDEAWAEARREEERQASGLQLRAFHETFNFCFSCRQYTCRDCWNEEAGRCRSCAPLPDRPDPLELRRLPPEPAPRPTAHPESAPAEVPAWPVRDLVRSDGGAIPAGEMPAQARPAPPAPAAGAPLAITSPVQHVTAGGDVESGAGEPVMQPTGPTPAAPVQPTGPTPATPLPWPRVPVRPPQPPAQAPAPWQIVAPDEPPAAPAGPAAQPGGVRERPVPSASPIGWMLRHRENTQPQVSPRVTRSVWEESTRDVVSRPGSGVQACQGCGLPLSASARFCRRCGARQI